MPLSLAWAEEKEESFGELSIKLKALQTVAQVEEYLKDNPNLTIKELQADPVFKKIAVQQVEESGYTAVIDVNSGYFYFHPQEILVNTDSHALEDKLPDFWGIISRTIGEECRESSGIYKWTEDDGSITKKYMYLACVDGATADGKNLFVGATAYLDETDASKYLEKYEVKKDFTYDEYFKEIAVQGVGKTGYTAVTDYNTLTCRFHSNPKIVDMDLHNLVDKLPGFWGIMSETEGGVEAEGIYDWEEADGSMKEKYMYITIVNAKTADGVGLSVAATTYLDEYEELEDSAIGDKNYPITEPQVESEEEKINFTVIVYWFLGGLAVISFVLFILNQLGIVSIERGTAFYLLAAALFLIIGLFILNTFQITQTLKKERIDSTVNHLLSIINSRENIIEYYLEEQKNKIQIAATHQNITNEELKAIRDSNEEFVEAFVLDSNGIIIDSSDESHVGANKASDSYFVNARNKSYIKPVYYSETMGEKAITVSTPFKEGVLVARLDLEILSEIVVDSTGLGETGESLLAYRNKNGDAEFFVNRRFIEEPVDITPKENIDAPVIQALLKNENVFLDYNDYRNIPVIAITRYIDELDVGLVTKMDKQEILGPITKALNRIWLFTVGMVFMIVLIGVIFNSLLTKSLRKEVAAKTVEAEGNAELIKGQLKKEEKISMEKEGLLKEQKKAKIDLENKIEELEKFQKLTVDRELKMIELKEKIKDLEKNNQII